MAIGTCTDWTGEKDANGRPYYDRKDWKEPSKRMRRIRTKAYLKELLDEVEASDGI
jgi:hypothetical protein|tara:strand:+ start:1621 stop:1788 length:168 start_codon:yes stop_codon:yes gene_type:complete